MRAGKCPPAAGSPNQGRQPRSPLSGSVPQRRPLPARLRGHKAADPCAPTNPSEHPTPPSRVFAERQRLLRLARQYEAIVESSEDAIISKDLSGRVISWNRSAERIFGYTATEMIGHPMTALMPADRLDEEGRILERICRGEKVEHFETARLTKDRRQISISVTLSPITDEQGRVIGASKIARDITERVHLTQRIWSQANHDELTRLPNRRLFSERLEGELARASRSGRLIGLMFIDLDRFKAVNDTLGHDAGDDLLIEAARRIGESVRAGDMVARLGGDEFTVLLTDLESTVEIDPIAARLIERIQDPFAIRSEQAQISASIGIAVYPDDGQTAETLLRHADQAMYEAKRDGRNRSRYFTRSLETAAQYRQRLAGELQLALERRQFELRYQPIMDMRSGRMAKCEAVIRWRHPELGDLEQAEFMPLAEESFAMQALSRWAIRRAMQQAAQWQRRFGTSIPIAIALSPFHLESDEHLDERWIQDMAELGVAARSLAIQVHERMLSERSDAAAERLRKLGRYGLQVAVDDFGAGVSCLAELQRSDVRYLRLSRSLIGHASPGSRESAMCEAIVKLAHTLGMQTVAVGVETEAQRAFVGRIGCDYAQGRLLALPMSPRELEGLMA
ncbi:MAG: EAL domain-containing protein [Burkholderiaceae bacterium]|nr:EAL domain-containing protein [Burkholderiaceae bacterium]